MRGGPAPRISDLALSVALHALVIGLVALRVSPRPAPPMPAVYRVDLVRPERIQPAPAPPQRPKKEIRPPKRTQARPRHQPEAHPLPRQDEPKQEPQVEERSEPKSVEPAPRNAAAPVTGPVRLDGDVRIADPYLQQIVARVNRVWRSTRGSGEARCVVYFRIVRNGRVEGARIEKASGSVTFDRAALSAVKRVGRFLPLPPSIRDRYLGVHFEFVREG